MNNDGGVVVDAEPQKHKRFRPEVVQRLKDLSSGDLGFWLSKLEELQVARIKDLEKQTGTGREQLLEGLETLKASGQVELLAEQWVPADLVRSWKQRLPEIVADYHKKHHLRHGMPQATLQARLSDKLAPKGFELLINAAVEGGEVVRNRDLISTPGWKPQPTEAEVNALERILATFRKYGFSINNNTDVWIKLGLEDIDTETFLSYLALEGGIVRLNQESTLDIDSYRKAERMLIEMLDKQGEFTLAEFRDKLGSSRKLTQGILEYFDGQKYTRRVGDKRVAWNLPEKK